MNNPNQLKKVLLIYTGGTLGMGRNSTTGALEPLDFNHLVKNIPEFRYINADIDVKQFDPPIDSSDMNPRRWAHLARIIYTHYDQYDGFVILHGTDTMSFTASALSFMLENVTKSIILTGSQLPVGQLRTDGKENLLTSIEIASAYDDEGHSMVPEVCIYFNGRLLRGNRSTKKNADGFNAFDSFNYPHLCDAGVNLVYHEHHILKPDFDKPLILHEDMDSNVIIFSLFPGIQEKTVRSLFNIEGLRGIVMRSYGSGNAPKQDWLIRILNEEYDKGVNVVNVSQCIAGKVEMARYDTGFQLKDAGLISGYDSTVEAAVTKLMVLQAMTNDNDVIRRLMNTSIAGEITV